MKSYENNRRTKSRNVLLLAVLLAPLAYAADEPASDEDASDQAQVIIEARRADLFRLEQKVLESERRFYDRYDQLNTVRKYAVGCDSTPETGSRMKRAPVCKPRFQVDAETEEARQFMSAMGASMGPTGGGAGRPNNPFAGLPTVAATAGGTTPASMSVEAQRPTFKRHMSEIVSQNPELQTMLQQHAAAWSEYANLYRKLNGRGPVPDKNMPDPVVPPAPSPDEPEGSD